MSAARNARESMKQSVDYRAFAVDDGVQNDHEDAGHDRNLM